MSPTPVPVPEPVPAAELPYAAATPDQRRRALAFLRHELAQHFPDLAEPVWQQVLDQHQPPLWHLADGQVELDFQDVTRLAQQLAAAGGLLNLDPPLYGHYAAYLARRLHGFARQAVGALAELEAHPTGAGPLVYELLTRLAAGNGIAAQVLEAVGELREGLPVGGRPDAADQQPGSPAVFARLDALGRARGTGYYALVPASPGITSPAD